MNKVKAWCCDKELECELKVFSNGTKHAWGHCPICNKTNYKQQRLPSSLDDVKHRLMSLYSTIQCITDKLDRDEAVAMVERFCQDLEKLV